MDAVQSVCMTLLQICSQMLSVCLCSSVPFLFIFWFLVKLTLKSFSAVFAFLTVRAPYVLEYQYFTSFEFVSFQQCQSILICKHLLSSWSISFSFFKVLRLVVVPACVPASGRVWTVILVCLHRALWLQMCTFRMNYAHWALIHLLQLSELADWIPLNWEVCFHSISNAAWLWMGI